MFCECPTWGAFVLSNLYIVLLTELVQAYVRSGSMYILIPMYWRVVVYIFAGAIVMLSSWMVADLMPS